MNHARIAKCCLALAEAAQDPTDEFDHLVFVTIQQLQEQLNTARECPPGAE